MKRLAKLLTHENITLISLYAGVPLVVTSLSDYRWGVASLLLVNFALYYYANRTPKGTK